MSTNKNWSKVVMFNDSGLVDRDATIASLDSYLDEQNKDQDAMDDAIDGVFASQPGNKNIVADTVLSLAAIKLSTDPDRFGELKAVGDRIVKAKYTVAKGQNGGYVNPYYVEPKKQ